MTTNPNRREMPRTVVLRIVRNSAVPELDVGFCDKIQKNSFFVRDRSDASATLEMVPSLSMSCPDHIPKFSVRSTPPSRGARSFLLQAPGHSRQRWIGPAAGSWRAFDQGCGNGRGSRGWPGACSENGLAPRLGGVERAEKFG